jgi:hypothetical protein
MRKLGIIDKDCLCAIDHKSKEDPMKDENYKSIIEVSPLFLLYITFFIEI